MKSFLGSELKRVLEVPELSDIRALLVQPRVLRSPGQQACSYVAVKDPRVVLIVWEIGA